MKKLLFWAAVTALPVIGRAQQQRQPEPTVQGFLLLPVALDNPIFDNLAAVLAQVDATFNLPLYKGLGIGAGVNHTWYELNERGLAPEETIGNVGRLQFHGKVFWAHYTGERTFYELGAKLGQVIWDWQCRTCIANQRQRAFTWGLHAGYFLHATENLAFGVTLDYQRDAADFNPRVIGLERFPGRTDLGAPYRFLTVGLGFSTGFRRSREGIDW